MRFLTLLLAVAFLAMAAPAFAQDEPAAPAKSLSEAEKTAIENVVQEYLTKKHPEVLMEAMKELQKREQDSAEAKSREAVANFKDRILNDPNSPIGGNPKGDVTVVEFFDFQCGYCKMSQESIQKLLKEDKNVKFIYKDFPILGPMSVTASKAALAAAKQGKYIKLHDALMEKKERLSDDMIYQLAKDAGIDVDKLKKDMASNEIASIIDANLKLGGDIGVRGTPFFVIGNTTYPGAMQFEQLKKSVDDTRAANKK